MVKPHLWPLISCTEPAGHSRLKSQIPVNPNAFLFRTPLGERLENRPVIKSLKTACLLIHVITMCCVCWDLKHQSSNIQGVQRERWWRYYSSTVGQSEGDASGKQVCSKCNKPGRKVLIQRQVGRTAPCPVFTAMVGTLTRMQIRLNKHTWDLRVALEGLRDLINASRCNKCSISTVCKRARGNDV